LGACKNLTKLKKENRPVLIGIGSIQQKDSFKKLDEALILMDKAVKNALNDVGNKKIKNYIDVIQTPKGFWRYRDPGKWIATNNQISNIQTTVSKIGVLQQSLINSVCKKISNGEIRCGIIVGGEARYKLLKSIIEKKEFEETLLINNPDYYIKAKEDLQTSIEEKELGSMAVGYYSIIESSFRAQSIRKFDEHHKKIAETYEKFSEIASKNMSGWIDEPFKWNEIIENSDKNPVLAFPYNKRHCTSWNVNQAAALIICSENIADELNIESDKRTYLIGSSENNHMISTIQRPNLSESKGLLMASKFILDICKKHNLNVKLFDLYSCFPVAVQLFAKALGIKDLKNATVTGGMSFAGGPLNSYVLNSTVKLIEELRKGKYKEGIVTGVSGMMTKQSFALWSQNPYDGFCFYDATNEASKVEKPIKISEKTSGEGKIIGYTVLKKDNEDTAIMVVEDNNNERYLVKTSDVNIVNSMTSKEWVNRKVRFKENILTS